MSKMRIGDLFEFEKGSLQSSKCIEGEFDFITASKEWKTHNDFSHNFEALIFAAMASGSLGRTHYVNGKFITSDLCYILTPKDNDKFPIDLKFYHFVFNSLKDEIVKNTKSGTSKEAINQTNLKNYEIPYFGIEQQHLWIEKLLKTKSIKENLTVETETQQSLLKKFRQGILQDAIEGKLTTSWREKHSNVESASILFEKIKAEKAQLIKDKKIKKQKSLPPIVEDEIPFDIPNNWVWCRLDEISLIGTGATPLTSNYEYYKDGNINWVTSSATGKDYVFEAEKKITHKAVLETNCNINPIGTLVIAMYGQGKTRGQITELMIEAATNQACATINPYLEKETLTQYLKKYFNMIYLEIRKLAAGGSQPNLNMLKIRKTIIPLPSLAEQKEIVKKIESLFKVCDELEEQINNSKTNSQTLMKAVLKEAFEK